MSVEELDLSLVDLFLLFLLAHVIKPKYLTTVYAIAGVRSIVWDNKSKSERGRKEGVE